MCLWQCCRSVWQALHSTAREEASWRKRWGVAKWMRRHTWEKRWCFAMVVLGDPIENDSLALSKIILSTSMLKCCVKLNLGCYVTKYTSRTQSPACITYVPACREIARFISEHWPFTQSPCDMSCIHDSLQHRGLAQHRRGMNQHWYQPKKAQEL